MKKIVTLFILEIAIFGAGLTTGVMRVGGGNNFFQIEFNHTFLNDKALAFIRHSKKSDSDFTEILTQYSFEYFELKLLGVLNDTNNAGYVGLGKSILENDYLLIYPFVYFGKNEGSNNNLEIYGGYFESIHSYEGIKPYIEIGKSENVDFARFGISYGF